MSSGVIREAKGLKFAGYNYNTKELVFQGTLGSTRYVFQTDKCEERFGLDHSAIFEFYYSADSSGPSPPGSPLEQPQSPTGTPALPKGKTSKDYVGRFLITLGCLEHPLDTEEGPPTTMLPAEGGGAGGGGEDGEKPKQHDLPLYVMDIEDLTVLCLVEAFESESLNTRYALRKCPPEAKRFDMSYPEIPYGFNTHNLYPKYFVREQENIYLSALQDTATVVGEAFGCLWVQLGSTGQIVPLPKATDEARLVTLYGLSDISQAGDPSSRGPVISPRQVQTPRATGRNAPPFTLNKRTADGKPAVLCNCPMGQTVLAVNSAEALKLFGVKPMGRIFFTLGVDAGKSATILGVRNGNLYIHIDGESKCVCLRNATNEAELRELYTGTGGATESAAAASKSSGMPTPSPAATMPKSLPRQASPPAGDGSDLQASSSSPQNIPRLSLNRVNSSSAAREISPQLGGMGGADAASGQQQQHLSPSPQPGGAASRSLASGSPASPPKGFYFWTAHGCLLFDISAETCKQFGLRHGQTVRFSSGIDAGKIFHVVGVRVGTVYVIPDRHEFAMPLRHCQNAEDIQSRVSPVLLGTTRLRSADPRAPPPHTQALRSPDRRAGSPFNLSPRNVMYHDEVDEHGEPIPANFGPVKSEESLARASSQAGGGGSGSLGRFAAREISFVPADSSSPAPTNSADQQQRLLTQPQQSAILKQSKSMSPSFNEDGSNNLLSAVQPSISISRPRGLSPGNLPGGASTTSHPLGFSTTTHPFAAAGGSSSNNKDSLLSAKPTNIMISPPPTSSSGGVSPGADSNLSTDNNNGFLGEKLSSAGQPIMRNTTITPPGPVKHEALKVGAMPSTRIYLKAIALRALGCKRETDMPTAFFRFFSQESGSGANLGRALQEMPKFIAYWEAREKPVRGGRSFGEATTDMMVEALENLAQLRGEY